MRISHMILGGIVLVAGVCGLSYVLAYNSANRAEQAILATYDNNENVLAQYGQKIAEAAQVVEIQRDDLVAIFTGALNARYGAQGSQGAMQWIQEQNPQLDSGTYKQIQQMVEAGRNEFRAAQTRLVDVKRGYCTNLGSLWTGTWMSVAGYPRLNVGFNRTIGSCDGKSLDDYPIITTDRASETFEKGRESGPIQLRQKDS